MLLSVPLHRKSLTVKKKINPDFPTGSVGRGRGAVAGRGRGRIGVGGGSLSAPSIAGRGRGRGSPGSTLEGMISTNSRKLNFFKEQSLHGLRHPLSRKQEDWKKMRCWN